MNGRVIAAVLILVAGIFDCIGLERVGVIELAFGAYILADVMGERARAGSQETHDQ